MSEQDGATFAAALREAIASSRSSQAKLARKLGIDAGQVSRWATGKAVPHADNVAKIEEVLGVDLSDAFSSSTPEYELYVSAPIVGLGRRGIGAHHNGVADVVESLRKHVNSLYWPGEGITQISDLVAPDIATERNMRIMARCTAFIYMQFAEVVHPSSALIELGYALGRRLKTTIFLHSDIQQPYMLQGFGAVAASLTSLPKARIYYLNSIDEACDLVEKNGRELLGLT